MLKFVSFTLFNLPYFCPPGLISRQNKIFRLAFGQVAHDIVLSEKIEFPTV